MADFFAKDFAGPPFASFGAAHIGALVVLLALNLTLPRIGRVSERARLITRCALAFTIWAAEAAWHVWNLAVGTWTPQTLLPLNTCSILIWFSGLMLLRKDFHIYEFAYFLGIGGALQYLATPDLGRYGFPHFRFFQAFTSHGLLLTAPIYMTLVEGFRPTWRSLRRVFIVTSIYAGLVFLVNIVLGSNYLMLNSKPATPSLLDLLPAWPYYLPFMWLMGVASCFLLYLPFLVGDARNARLRSLDKTR